MAKGDDAVTRKRNRAHRKRGRSLRSKESVSARVAAIIAAKRRRKTGKRRICQGMCFTLPTPEDPFNDRNDPKSKRHQAMLTKERKNKELKTKRNKEAGARVSPVLNKCPRNTAIAELSMSGGSVGQHLAGRSDGDSDNCLSKYLVLCLKAIRESWAQEDAYVDQGGTGPQPPLLACKWGIDFWKSCSSGLDIVDSSGACASREQVAWLVSAASDIIASKEKQGLLVSSPFLVFLVPSQEKATEIRSVCKPLKALGVHTVSLHPGASLDHQICGLKSCEPEFVVSTPERLLDLVNLKALNISGVSLLVLDGLESLVASGFLDELKSIRERISGDPQTVVFSDKHGEVSSFQLRSLLKEPVCRVSLHGSMSLAVSI